MIKIERGGMQVLSNLTTEQKTAIKKDLSIDNPAYIQAKKFSKYGYTSIPPYLTYYMQEGKSLIVPRGYQVPFHNKVISDDRIEKYIPYPKIKIDLRDDQEKAYRAFEEANREKGTIVMATGKGKSILGIYLAYKLKQRTLVIVNKSDLFVSWQKDIEMALGLKKNHIGIIKAKKFKIGSQITLATIQTLTQLPVSVQQKLYKSFGLVIIDEMHHISANSYHILKYFQSKYMVGLTATDNRGDGLTPVLYFLCGEVCFRSKYTREDADIMPYTVKIRESNLEYNPPQLFYYKNSLIDSEMAKELKDKGQGKFIKRKPLDPQELKSLLKTESFNKQVAKDIIHEYSLNKSIVAFLHEKEHIRLLRDLLVLYGAKNEDIGLFYGDNKESDEEFIRKAEDGTYKITLATFSKATEGTNVKRWDTAFLVTSLNNEKNVEQAIGRIRRRKEGKKECIVYTYSHPNVSGLKSHINTQLRVFRKTKAIILGLHEKRPKGKITRGFGK